MISNNYDDVFSSYMNTVKEAEQAKSEAGKKPAFVYDEIQYCTLKEPKIVRIIGGPINSGCDNISPRTITVCDVIDDEGKKMKIYRPGFRADRNYILNRILNAVTKKVFVENADGTKTGICPCERDYPELYNRIMKNGVAPSDPQYKFQSGLMGSEVVVANVIDRGDYAMHQQTKHTSILCKDVNEYKGRTYPNIGISWYASQPSLETLTSAYGNLQGYDVYIKRTGEKSNPYIIKNAQVNIAEIDASLRGLISDHKGLTQEESEFEAYDLDKYYHPTTATKIISRLKNLITEVDEKLGTNFISELEVLAAKEKEEADKKAAENGAADDAAVEFPKAPAARVVESAAPATVSSDEPYKALLHWENMSQEERDNVQSVTSNGKGGYDIVWKNGLNSETLPPCPKCGTPSYASDKACPCCGTEWENI